MDIVYLFVAFQEQKGIAMDSVQFELKSQMKPHRPFRLIANPYEKGYEMKLQSQGQFRLLT